MIKRFYLFPIFWALIIGILILMPGDKMPDTGDIWAFDKIAHAGVFAILAVLTSTGLSRHKKTAGIGFLTIFFAILSCICYGIILELVQMLVPDREFDIKDMYANIAGVILGTFAFYIIYKI